LHFTIYSKYDYRPHLVGSESTYAEVPFLDRGNQFRRASSLTLTAARAARVEASTRKVVAPPTRAHSALAE
jgi:hypothetical protein